MTSATGTISGGATSPYPFYVLDLSAASPAVVRIFGVDITVDSETLTLAHIPFTERGKFGGPRNTSEPVAWSIYGTSKIAIFPPPSGSYTYVVWYLPVLADLSADGDTFDGVSGWEDFIVWDVVVRSIVKDQYPNAYAMAVNERDRIWLDILQNATRVTSAGGGVVGRDTFGERMRWARG